MHPPVPPTGGHLAEHQRDDVADLRAVGSRLVAAGYDEASLAAALGLVRLADLLVADIPVYERRLDDGAPLDTLVRLFLFGHKIPVSALERILPAGSIDALCRHGLVEQDGAFVRPLARITPFDGFLFAHDPYHQGKPTPDYVLGVTPASRILHGLTVRPVVDLALDVGTGCGVQALCMARHARHVIATDVNSRALRFTTLNAALNGIDNVDVRMGNLLEPVAGETFDLVIANPPFILSPDDAYAFRDAGHSGNVSQSLVAAMTECLRPGGFAQMLINWEVSAADEWERVPRNWIDGTKLDGWLLCYGQEDGLSYAAKWNAWLRDTDPSRFASALDRWTAYYAGRGVLALATGAMTLRCRVEGDPWWRTDHIVTESGARSGDQVLRVFDAQDQLQGFPDDASFLSMTPRWVEPHRLHQTLHYREGSYVVEEVWVRLVEGVGVVCTLEPQALLVILAIDGQQTLGQLLNDAREGLSVDEAQYLDEVVTSSARQLIRLGMITLDGP